MADYYGITLTFNDLNVLVQKTYYIAHPSSVGILRPIGFTVPARGPNTASDCAASATHCRLPQHRLR